MFPNVGKIIKTAEEAVAKTITAAEFVIALGKYKSEPSFAAKTDQNRQIPKRGLS